MNDLRTDLRLVRLERGASPDLLDQVEVLYCDLHTELAEGRALVPLPPGGERRWRENIEVSLGRAAILTLAMTQDERLVGFHHAALAFLPDYLGGGKIARVLSLYVAGPHRGIGIGRHLSESAEEWMRMKGATSVEVQASVTESSSRGFWEKLGMTPELIQLRRPVNGG